MAGLTLEQLEERTVLAFMEQATAEEFAKVVEKIPNKTEALQKILNLLEDDELAKLLEERKKMKQLDPLLPAGPSPGKWVSINQFNLISCGVIMI